MDGVIAFVTPFAGNFAPRNWALCQGQILSISQNTALFSLLGTTYGGNGQSTFGLPDLRGRAVVGTGQGPGLSDYVQGEIDGSTSHTLPVTEMPIHTHLTSITTTPKAGGTPNSASPVNAVYATGNNSLYTFSTNVNLHNYPGTLTTQVQGGSTPFSILHPMLTLNYLICMQGIFPSRN
ncbi:MAG: phage tail protein [Flavisolibacter sp.]|jgi:microcystin-dependent protein